MSYSRWNIPYGAPKPAALLEAGYSPLLAAVLQKRGLGEEQEAGRFVSCSASLLGDAMTMADMGRAAERLRRAIASREKIAVYGDYDVDGITSTCLLYDYLRSRGADAVYYIPDRIEEGYGVNRGAVEQLHRQGVRVIVTVDCGVTAVEEAVYAAELGVEMIITDHHECQDELPAAAAVVDPKRPDCAYPNQELAGVGVAFKLLCALEGEQEALLERYADLVAVGTIADVMPMRGENRYMIRAGLEKLNRDPRPGLKALIAEAGLGEKHISATSVGYILAPRINAAGRLGRSDIAAKLLLSDESGEAAGYAAALCRLNRERQALETSIWEEATAMLREEKPDGPIVLAHEGWHQGVIGIAASRLTEAYGVPAVMICLDGPNGKGSCRSYGGFNLFEALSACSGELESFGGHALAAGLTIRRENVDAFRTHLSAWYREHPPKDEAVLDIDVHVDAPELLEMRAVEDLEQLEPCGTGNPSAQLCLTGARLEAVTPIGGGRHLRLRLGRFGRSYDAVYFGHTAQELKLSSGAWVDAAFQVQINEYRSRRSVQLLLTEVRGHDGAGALAVLRGETPPAEARPEREDFVRVWRRLSAAGGEAAASVPELSERLGEAWDVKLCVCLKVMEELGLLTLSEEGETLRVRACRVDGKVDLDSSRLLQSMKQGGEDHEKIQ